MQLSTSLQNTFPIPLGTILSQQTSITPTEQINEKTNSINKNAYDYFDLGTDLSQNMTTDLTQEKTNKELVNYLTSLMNNSTSEGKNNLNAFDTKYSSTLFFQLTKVESLGSKITSELMLEYENHKAISYEELDNFTIIGYGGEKISNMNRDEVFEFLGDDAEKLIKRFGTVIGVDFDDRQKQYAHEQATQEYIPDPDKIKYFNNFEEITKDEDYKIRLNEFKNLYSLSDEFSQTQEFKENYEVYQEQVSQTIKEAHKNKQDIKDYVGAESFITSEVVKNSYSRSEVIEDYTNRRDALQELLQSDRDDSSRNIGATYVKKIEDAISMYDTMVKDLKDMWGYGNLDINN
ncbi:MAG: cob(I)alamin adenosyltransferase [Sulfurimonas sp.]|jgi:cob(I)alamin adenosyltransferase|uniref:hypothetical protein n=1 Tax=Sulfurimonas sp. TaxID=2022749 RepID=UPI0039E4DF92